MKVLSFATFFVLIVVAIVVVAGQIGLLKGKKPNDIGVQQGRLKPPSTNPNSVSSQTDLYPAHLQRDYASIAPFKFSGDGEKALQKIAEILRSTERTEIIVQESDYVYAQCKTKVMKFIDDIEFWLDRSAGVIQVRSASRLGRKDFNINRARVEAIRAQFDKN